jgi:hypothetical protein
MIKTASAQARLDPRDPRQRFPVPIHAMDDLPPGVRDLVQPRRTPPAILRIPPGAYPIRRTVWGIELPFGWRRTPERFLLFDQETITIVESDPLGNITATDIPLAALIEIRHVAVLLYAYLELVWVDGGHIEVKKVEYNSVGQYLLEREIDRVRALHPPCLSPAPAQDREAILAPLPFKFRNYLRGSLLSDEQLLAAVFQPAIRRAVGPLHTYIAPNRALGVTERCLIVIEDRQHQRYSEADYAILQYFYPLSHLQNITVDTTPEVGWLRLQHGAAGSVQQTDIPLMPEPLDVLTGVLRVSRA